MLDTPVQTVRVLLDLRFAPEQVAQMLVDDVGASSSDALSVVSTVARALQEEEIEFTHTVTEHEAAIAAEWRE